MACRHAIVPKIKGGEESTPTNTSLTGTPRFGVILAKAHYVFLAPIIMLGIPAIPFLLTAVIGAVVALAGLSGTFLGEKHLVLVGSSSLLSFLIAGKVASDVLRLGSPDTAVLLAEFGMVLFFMETALVAIDFDQTRKELGEKEDEVSQALGASLAVWLRKVLSRQGKIAVGSIGLSILLLPLAGITGVSSGELPLTGALVLIAIVALLFLVTHRREPEKGR